MICRACRQVRAHRGMPCPYCGLGGVALEPPAGFADRVLARHQQQERRRTGWAISVAAVVVGLAVLGWAKDQLQTVPAPATPAVTLAQDKPLPLWNLPRPDLDAAPQASIALTLKAASEVGRHAGRWLPAAEPWTPPLDVDPIEATRVPALYVRQTLLGSVEPVRLSATRAWRQFRTLIETDKLELLRSWTGSS